MLTRVKDLAQFVKNRERELAYGSETCLLTAFVSDFGYMSDALHDESVIDQEVFDLWVDAYENYERLSSEGFEFDVSDLF